MAAAQDELSTIAARLAAAYPETNRSRRVVIEDLQHAMVGPVKPMLLLLAGAIAMLLAVACANIANLLLAQAHARSLELGIRAAVGASRGRLARQLWTESLALFGVAGAIGVVLAQPLALALISRYPDTLPLAADVQLDGRVLAIAVACTLTAALVAGLPRMRRLTDTQAGAALRGDARSGLTKEHRRITTIFVAAQVAVSIVLLFGGVLLLRTFMNLTSTAPGFDPRDVVTIRASIPTAESSDPDGPSAFQDTLADAARSLPGVTAAAHAMFIPFTQGLWGDGYRRAGTADPEPRGPIAHFFMVSPEYLGVMGMPVLQGRGITAADDGKAPPVLVVSETFAKRAFPGETPIGRRLEWDGRHLGNCRGHGRRPPRVARRSRRRGRLRAAPPGRARQHVARAQDEPAGRRDPRRAAGAREGDQSRRRADRCARRCLSASRRAPPPSGSARS